MFVHLNCVYSFHHHIYLPQSHTHNPLPKSKATLKSYVSAVCLYTSVYPLLSLQTRTDISVYTDDSLLHYLQPQMLFVRSAKFKDVLCMLCLRQLRWKAEETDLLMGTLGAPPANLHTEPLCLEHRGMYYYQPGCISQTPHRLQSQRKTEHKTGSERKRVSVRQTV